MKIFITSLHQNMLSFLKSPALWVVIVMPIFILFTIGSIYPASWVLPQIITLSIMIVSFLSVGIQYSNYRKTQFFRTVRNTSVPVYLIILGTVIVVSIVSFCLSIFLMITTFFFTNAVPILCQTIDNVNIVALQPYRNLLDETAFYSTFSFSSVHWLKLIYSLLISVIMTSLFAVMIANLITNERVYILISLFYITIYIMLGGIIFPLSVIYQSEFLEVLSFLIPNVHTNSLIISSLDSGVGTAMAGTKQYIHSLDNYLESIASLNSSGIYEPNWEILLGLTEDGDQINNVVGDDFLQIGAIISVSPYLFIILNLIGQILSDFLGISSNIDTAHALRALFVILGLIDLFGENNFNLVYSNIKDISYEIDVALNSIFISGNAFSLDSFGLRSNLIPLFVIIVSFPTFIKVVMS